MSGNSDDDIERLASRLALLVSDTGEADNAGRAAGAMARRLGLSGGDLKAMFIAGAASQPGERGDTPTAASLARQLSALRHALTLAEVASRNAERERDALRMENETLRASLDRQTTQGQVTRIIGTVLVAASVAGGVYTIARPAFREPVGARSATAEPAGSPFARAAVVRASGARLYGAPNRTASVIASLAPGTRLTVRRLVVNILVQWAEVEFAGTQGYVVTTDVDMP